MAPLTAPRHDTGTVQRSIDRLLRDLHVPGLLTGRARDGVERVARWAQTHLSPGTPWHSHARARVLAASADLLPLLAGEQLTPEARRPVALALRVADQLRDAEVT